jgi:hypothetical protein
MTEFTVELRRMCRNPRCRSKLPAPVSNPREAFCSRGCYTSFHLHRCLVCEGQLGRKNETQKVCRKSKCRSTFRRGFDGGRYHVPSAVSSASKTLDSIDSKPAPKADRPWFIVAGPPMTPLQLHRAALPNDEYRRIEAKNRAALKAAEQAEIEANGYFTEPDWREVVSRDGVRCFVTRIAPSQKRPQQALPPIPDDLSTPTFLRRPLMQPEPERRAA